MIATYTITNFDDQTIATVLVDISADESEYGILLALEEGGKTAEQYLSALLGGELLMAEEVGSYWPEMPYGDGWTSGPQVQVPLSYRWADGFEPQG